MSTRLIRKLLGAALLAGAALSASAQTTSVELVTGQDFYLTFDFGDIASPSNLVGSFFASPSFNTGLGNTIPLQAVTFTTVTFKHTTSQASDPPVIGDLDSSLTGFSFHGIGPRTQQEYNMDGGHYFVKVGGYLSGPSLLPGVGLIGINYTLTPVPEPESFAMLLAGLGLIGAVTRLRRKASRLAEHRAMLAHGSCTNMPPAKK